MSEPKVGIRLTEPKPYNVSFRLTRGREGLICATLTSDLPPGEKVTAHLVTKDKASQLLTFDGKGAQNWAVFKR